MSKHKEPSVIQELEEAFGVTATTIVVVTLAIICALVVFFWAFFIPTIRYHAATAYDKCQIDLKKLNDSDAFCDESNTIQSKQELAAKEAERLAKEAEKVRRAALTPKERCQEDRSSRQYNDEHGLVAICNDDGTLSYHDFDKELEDYYNNRETEASCNIKGNISYSSGEKIYHVPGDAYYDDTVIDTQYGERWFCSENEARAAGWRRAYY